MFRQIALHVLAAAPIIGLALAPTARAEDPPRVSGPYTHENLSIYFIHGKSADGPVPLTLEEALARGTVQVHETGTVSQLQIENRGKDEVFVHAGDIVKGGKQDRVVTASFLLSARSPKTDIPVYCVEAGRWTARGREDVGRFLAATEMLPTKEAKLAMMAGPSVTTTASVAPAAEPQPRAQTIEELSEPRQEARTNRRTVDRGGLPQGPRSVGGQSEVWRNVAEIQGRLSKKLNAKVNSELSQSSLQLALENRELATRQAQFVAALKDADKDAADIVGYAIAVNGKIASADVYPSNALFTKLWPRLLKAAATEAIGADEVKDVTAPDVAAVQAFLAQPADVKADEAKPVDGMSVTARSGETFYDAESFRGSQFVHRSKLAR